MQTSAIVNAPIRRTRFARLAAVALGAFLAVVLALPAGVQAKNRPDSFADLADALLPTVVNISTTQKVEESPQRRQFEEFFEDFFNRRREGQPQPPGRQGPRRAPSSLGSGFVIDEDGYIVTNNHVIEGADEITVRFHDDTTMSAELVGRDDKTDLALLKVDTDRKLKAASWGDSTETRIGDWVLAIGNPFGLGGTVTAGIVSARSRDINAGPYDDFIQTDASINRGNSGGPMFNTDGDVIGVNTAIFSPSGGSIGIGFAIPSEIAENVVQQLREYGDVRRAWLGVRIQSVTEELAEGLRLDHPRGALVASVSEGGPAENAGIRQGDVILRFDGKDVGDMRELPRMVAETRIGKKVDVVVWRKGERETVEVDLGKLDEDALASFRDQESQPNGGTNGAETSSVLGMGLAELNEDARQRFGLDENAKGVVITEVDPSSSAAEKGLSPGDVIVEVDQEEVNAPGEVAQKIEQARKGGYRVVTLLVYNQGDFRWVAVRLG
ncbi:DegQ family serine endoprotease [Rhodovibrio salinarum]|uniref:DegQ family serine endoprotease n=1 Tax=Rhodovibrio salinarum TaxID=1087 RepID=UPI001F5BD83B|nr:DegQ family serine endoprotease [Rhodovibrio salinarum]